MMKVWQDKENKYPTEIYNLTEEEQKIVNNVMQTAVNSLPVHPGLKGIFEHERFVEYPVKVVVKTQIEVGK